MKIKYLSCIKTYTPQSRALLSDLYSFSGRSNAEYLFAPVIPSASLSTLWPSGLISALKVSHFMRLGSSKPHESREEFRAFAVCDGELRGRVQRSRGMTNHCPDSVAARENEIRNLSSL